MNAQQITRAVATAQLVLIFPATLFIGSVALRYLPPLHDSAQRIVMMYAGKAWTLWLLLLTLPLCVLVTGLVTLLREWNVVTERSSAVRPSFIAVRQPSILVVAATTFTSAGILIIVVLHMLAN